MKHIIRWAWLPLLILTLSLGWALPARAAQPEKLITGGNFTLESGDVLNENLTVIGGNVTLESGSTVNGDISLTAGIMEIAGKVNGDVVVTSASLSLLSGAEVNGNITLAASILDRAEDAVVTGDITQSGTLDQLPERRIRLPATLNGFQTDELPIRIIWTVLSYIGQVFLLAALAVLGAVFFDQHLGRVAHAAVQQPLATGAMGLMTILVALIAVVFLSVTIIFIPLAILLVLALLLVAVYGWLAIGFEVGERFAAQFKQVWAPPLSAGLGTLFLSAVLLGVGWIPCLGWTIVALVVMVGIGAALLTRMGTTEYTT